MTKASDNAFPSILITEGTEPSAPAAGKQRLYIDSTTHKLKRTNSAGVDVDIEGAAAAVAGYVLDPSSDTYIDQQGTTTNFDTSTTLLIGNKWGTASFTRFALFTFDTSALAGKTIYRAALRLCRVDTVALAGTSEVFQARRVLRAYNPTQVTWNAYATGNNWTTAGAESAGNDVAAEVHGATPAITAPLAGHFLEIEISRLVQEDLDAASTTLRLIVGKSNADGSINAAQVASKDHATAANRPKLMVIAA